MLWKVERRDGPIRVHRFARSVERDEGLGQEDVVRKRRWRRGRGWRWFAWSHLEPEWYRVNIHDCRVEACDSLRVAKGEQRLGTTLRVRPGTERLDQTVVDSVPEDQSAPDWYAVFVDDGDFEWNRKLLARIAGLPVTSRGKRAGMQDGLFCWRSAGDEGARDEDKRAAQRIDPVKSTEVTTSGSRVLLRESLATRDP